MDTILGTLLLRNNCVVIPSLGGFIANSVSAHVDIEKGLVTPPKKAINFNKNLTNNDGLLVHHLANSQSISYDEANKIIGVEVQKVKEHLNAGKRVSFNNVGFLYINNAGKIAFEQDRFFNLLLSSYGMGMVQFVAEETENDADKKVVESVETVPATEEAPTREVQKPVTKTVSPLPKAEKTESKGVAPIPAGKEVVHPSSNGITTRKIISKVIKYTAVAALVPVLFYSYWIPMKTDVLQSGVVYTTDFNPFETSAEERYIPEVNPTPLGIDSIQTQDSFQTITENLSSSTPVFSFPIDDDFYINVRRKKADAKDVEKVKSNRKESTLKRNQFHAIVGCFSNPTNANEIIESLKAQGFDAYEVDVKGGLHRVSAGDASSSSQMQELRNRLMEKDFSSWVLKK
ncbi:HU domain-containing protein [Brumimicrobium salinarum]|uniref:HU domain-containing protein n=1 Tax=Brumimicrobium salinarum TaxID=2058658 RepID=UPI0013FD49E5|nr:SPOR domain-containing protein [Brumimicrobium salinarum]